MANDICWDVIVVGGGPAGMMAAGRAAECGAKVVVVEKNDKLGKKLLITGGGRCNLTNSEFDVRKFLSKFKNSGKFLFSAFSQHGVGDSLEFFHGNGLDTKVEPGMRTFPVSDSARSVLDVLLRNMKNNGVFVSPDSPVAEILRRGEIVTGVRLKNSKVIIGKSVVIATGGTSHPETGSTGDAYKWLEGIGHKIITPVPSLVPIALKDSWIKKLAGVSLDGVKVSVYQNGEKRGTTAGKILFTHVGLSGPTILNMSRDIGELLKYGEVVLSLDIFPKTDQGALDLKIQSLFKKNDKKNLRNALAEMLPSALAAVVLELAKIPASVPCNSVTRESRKMLAKLLKNLNLNVKSLLGKDKAIITSGGVPLTEVDFKTMSSKIYPNLYLIGDILDIDRPSGGYSLQLCWTTGSVAGTHAAEAALKSGR